jgi:hypothetical protein
MPIVKPPTFNELVKTYGSPKAAVLHLLKAGFSPEQIQWKMGVPYHRIRLYMEGLCFSRDRVVFLFKLYY